MAKNNGGNYAGPGAVVGVQSTGNVTITGGVKMNGEDIEVGDVTDEDDE